MQDVEKTEIQSQTSSKRRRRRNRFRPLYGLLVAILVIGVGVSLSMTVFFNIEQIVVAGDANQPYQKNDVVKASGVHTGDNMMRLNRETVKENILSRLIFVDNGSDVFSNRLRILTIFIYKILVAVVWLTLMWICLTGMLKLKKLVMRMGLYLVWISNLSKAWAELKEQLLVAGLFTEHITNFSWVTFKKGTNNYEGHLFYERKQKIRQVKSDWIDIAA